VDESDEGAKIKIFQNAERLSKTLILADKAYLLAAEPMQGQVGGKSISKKPVLTLPPNFILKPLRNDVRGFRETAFYEAIRESLERTKEKGGEISWKSLKQKFNITSVSFDRPDIVCALQGYRTSSTRRYSNLLSVEESMLLRKLTSLQLISNYFGVVKLPQNTFTNSTPQSYLILTDATSNFRKPCVMDLKMGQKTFEPDAPPAKKAREIKKYPLQHELGFRIVGMRTFEPETVEYHYYDKKFGRSLISQELVREAFSRFFPSIHPRGKPISGILLVLNELKEWLEENKLFAFYASSLLLVFEGENGISSSCNYNVKMIDFAHVRKERGGDTGYLYGVEKLMVILKSLLSNERHMSKSHGVEA
jgi:1D-myo-inositol-tetrakisphosphate 5-kinase/inositol-polyphosphate multikinase